MGALTYLVRPKTVSCPSSVTRLGCFRFAARPSVLSEAYDLVDPRGVGRANATSLASSAK
ncbi:hypothetical protein B296_00007558 [Ensete ventricosum]|uniref:Uncharacterized protein n=1 Tax=Ensete ventricosum TaxID=4639 RepID=A0A426ZXF7_ENSVE|nr:hypothetical protein B296_00007558 [Ensete ventricosum]